MLDALPPALEEGEKCRTVHWDGERYGGYAGGGGGQGGVMVPAAGEEADAGRLAARPGGGREVPHSPRGRREVWGVCRGGSGEVCYQQLGKKLMLDALPPGIEKGRKCRTVRMSCLIIETTSLDLDVVIWHIMRDEVMYMLLCFWMSTKIQVKDEIFPPFLLGPSFLIGAIFH
jgi:hypothetical protein